MKTLIHHVFQIVNDLGDVTVISLTSKLEHLIHVFGILREPSCVLVLIFNINLHFDGLAINFDALAFRVIDKSLIDELIEQYLWKIVVCHRVPCHLQLIEIVLLSDDISHNALIVHQTHLESVSHLNLTMLLPDDL